VDQPEVYIIILQEAIKTFCKEAIHRYLAKKTLPT